MEKKAVIFDMDGVLIDAREWHYQALNKALDFFGYTISRYDHIVDYDGLPTREKLEKLTRERGLPGYLHKIIRELKQMYTMEQIHTKCKPVFQHQYALSRLREEGYQMAVASNSVRDTVDLMLEKSGLAGYFEFTLSNQDVQNGKPDPEIYRKAIERLGLLPEECLIVEDNQNGIRAARASGACVMQVETVNDVTYANLKSHLCYSGAVLNT